MVCRGMEMRRFAAGGKTGPSGRLGTMRNFQRMLPGVGQHGCVGLVLRIQLCGLLAASPTHLGDAAQRMVCNAPLQLVGGILMCMVV
jgi:hypothetical protein